MTDEAYRTEHFGLDERTAQSARDVMDILVGNALAISALDLDTGELRLIKRGIELPQIEADKPMLFSTFNNLLIAQKLIHPEDGDGYLRGTALSALRTVFFGGEKQVYLRYRQKVDGEYRWVALAIVAGKRCESGCAQVAMVLSGANGSGHANRPSEPRGVDYDCDPLTGLLNRRRFERDLEWWGRNRPETLTCVYIDVVGLHEINNHLGHKAGDGMLCAVAGAMQRMFPLADTYRIGGDEFVVLWADHTGEQGAEAAARIKALLRESNYEISVGVHQIEPDENLEDGVDRAENAMRRDKEAYYRETGNLDQMRVLNEKLELGDQATKKYTEFFWNGDDLFRIALNRGEHGALFNGMKAEPVGYFMYPYAEVDGKALDYFDPKNFEFAVSFRAD